MDANRIAALVGVMLAGAALAAGPTIPPEVAWYWHTVVAAVNGGAIGLLLLVDPTLLAQLRGVSGAKE